MNLYLMRHAQAAPVGGAISRDADRILTPRGKEDAVLVGRALAHLDPQISLIVTSPLARARETGEIVRREFGDQLIVRVSNNLAPGFLPQSLFEEVIAWAPGASIVAIGHQPDMGKFIAFLIAESHSAGITMESGAVARVLLSSPLPSREAYLSWLITPESIKNTQW